MRRSIALVLLITFSAFLVASDNGMGIAQKRDVQFFDPIKIGSTLVPAGEYVVTHSMDGEKHIMTFTNKDPRKVVTVKIECTLQPLEKRATRSETGMVINASNQLELKSLIFKGDKAEHVF
jgi:hypothetical protein